MDEAGVNLIPADLLVEHNGAQIPFRETEYVKQTPDFVSLLKRGWNDHRDTGRALVPPANGAKPEDIAAFREKVYKTGHVMKPPERPDSPDKYEIVKPESLPRGMEWKDELTVKARDFFHKNHFTAEQAKAAVAFQTQLMGEMVAPVMAEYDAGMAGLKTEWGDKFDDNSQKVGRVSSFIFGDETSADWKFINESGMGNTAPFNKLMLKLYDYVQQDSGFLENFGPQSDPADLQEAKNIMAASDPQNPLHAKWKAWKTGQGPEADAVKRQITDAFAKAFPGEVTI